MTLGGRRFLLGSAVVGAAVCLMLGVSLPFIKLTRPVFFASEHSLVSVVNALMRSSQPVLGTVALIFAVFLPVLKLLYLVLLVALPPRDVGRLAGQLRALEWLGKWSLQDVLVLSLTILLIRSQGAHAAAVAGGAYFFAAAVLLMMLAYTWLPSDVIASRARAAKAAPATRSLAFGVVVALAAVLFALGATLPATRLTNAYVGTNQHSIASIVWALYTRQEFFLCLVIFTLAILLPVMKLLYLLALLIARYLPYSVRAKSILAMQWLGPHSTTDVMVLMLLAFYLNASGYSQTQLQPGVYLFAASALTMMLAYGWANSVAPASTAQPSSLQARLAGLASPRRGPTA